jgi:hypothetical protein
MLISLIHTKISPNESVIKLDKIDDLTLDIET